MNEPATEPSVRSIISGRVGFHGPVERYQRFMTEGDLVEQYWWGALTEPIDNDLGTIADEGWVWVRFWLRDQGVVLDKVFDVDLNLIGTHIDVTSPISVDDRQWRATDLLLDVWLWPDGRVNVLREEDYEECYRNGFVDPGQAKRAELQVRDITRWIAKGEFPPAYIMEYTLRLDDEGDGIDPT